jgi:hypothetical protein
MIMYGQDASLPPGIDEKSEKSEDAVEPMFQPSSLPDLSPSTDNTDAKSRMLVALYDFQGLEQDELSFKAGDVVKVLQPHSAGQWRVRRISDDAIGVVSSSYFVSAL